MVMISSRGWWEVIECGIAVGWHPCCLVLCLVWMPWFSISVPSIETEAWKSVILGFNLGKTEIIRWRKLEVVWCQSIYDCVAIMNYSQWILDRHWEINTNCFVLSAFTPKIAFVLLDGDVYCYLQAENETYRSTYDWFLIETQTPRENKILLTRGSILLGVPYLAIYLEFVNLLLVSWSALPVKSSPCSCVSLQASLWGAGGAGAAVGLCLSPAPWGLAGQTGHAGGGFQVNLTSSLQTQLWL